MLGEEKTKFDYLLNAFELASQARCPFEAGYPAKRQALFEYVRKLEERQAAAPDSGEAVGKVVAATGSENDAAMIQWTSDYRPTIGDKLYTTPQQAQPVARGWKLVPIEPTSEMLTASYNCDQTPAADFERYRKMLVAAPTPPSAPAGDQVAALINAVLDLNTGWNNKEPEHLIADRLDLARRLAKNLNLAQNYVSNQDAKRLEAIRLLSHRMDDAALGITEGQAYALATELRVLIGIDGDEGANEAIATSSRSSND